MRFQQKAQSWKPVSAAIEKYQDYLKGAISSARNQMRDHHADLSHESMNVSVSRGKQDSRCLDVSLKLGLIDAYELASVVEG